MGFMSRAKAPISEPFWAPDAIVGAAGGAGPTAGQDRQVHRRQELAIARLAEVGGREERGPAA